MKLRDESGRVYEVKAEVHRDALLSARGHEALFEVSAGDLVIRPVPAADEDDRLVEEWQAQDCTASVVGGVRHSPLIGDQARRALASRSRSYGESLLSRQTERQRADEALVDRLCWIAPAKSVTGAHEVVARYIDKRYAAEYDRLIAASRAAREGGAT